MFSHAVEPVPYRQVMRDIWSTVMVRDHQPGEAVFKSILPEDVDWKPFPAVPPAARLAVLVGEPTQAGPYLIRVKVPSGVKLMPHKHPEDRIYTVISGVFYVGLGDRFDAEDLKAYPPGSVVVLPCDTWHFHWAKSGEYVTQVTAIGPLGLEYKEADDDPRKRSSAKLLDPRMLSRRSLASSFSQAREKRPLTFGVVYVGKSPLSPLCGTLEMLNSGRCA
jgi:quercetin dioxygenase-like cupin family protein